jgi:hypothetical protein
MPHNIITDLCWYDNDSKLIVGSGDDTLKVLDVNRAG